MKYLLVLLFLSGCSLIPKYEPPVSRQKNIIACVDNFLEKGVDAKLSHEICKDIYNRKG
jgi:hypothetical protein